VSSENPSQNFEGREAVKRGNRGMQIQHDRHLAVPPGSDEHPFTLFVI
jgi:hypothetical protein